MLLFILSFFFSPQHEDHFHWNFVPSVFATTPECRTMDCYPTLVLWYCNKSNPWLCKDCSREQAVINARTRSGTHFVPNNHILVTSVHCPGNGYMPTIRIRRHILRKIMWGVTIPILALLLANLI
jgi:hypothetical protein